MVESRKQELTRDTLTTFLESKRVWLPGWSNLLYICKRAKWEHYFSHPFKARTQTLSQHNEWTVAVLSSNLTIILRRHFWQSASNLSKRIFSPLPPRFKTVSYSSPSGLALGSWGWLWTFDSLVSNFPSVEISALCLVICSMHVRQAVL